MSRIRLRLLLNLIFLVNCSSLVRLGVCEEVDPDAESVDDELISKLLDIPVANTAEDSDVSHILKILEAGEHAATTEAAITSTSTEPPIITTSTTTEKPSPFFKTERPFSFSSRRLENTEAQLNSIISTLMESEKLLNSNVTDISKATQITRRSDSSQFPPLDSLLLNTAEAIWDVSKPAFFATKAGRKISLLHNTVKLPLRTFGHLKHKILDLTSGHYSHTKRSILNHNHHQGHSHHHGHSWGWGEDPVYIKYEPENSLFKAWLRHLYKSLRPVVISKIRLKKKLIRMKLRVLVGVIRFLKSAKLQKFLAGVRALISYIKSRRTSLVVLKEAGHSHGWGWQPPPPPATKGWGWSRSSAAAAPTFPPMKPMPMYGAPPSIKPMYGPPPTQDYSYAASSPPEISYGPPAQSSYGQQRMPSQGYGLPTSRPSPEAYNQDNIYGNYYSSPSQELIAPEAQSSENVPKVDSPSYANYLKQFGINPSSLSDSETENVRSFRETNNKQVDDDDVPYLAKEDEAGEVTQATSNNNDKPSRI